MAALMATQRNRELASRRLTVPGDAVLDDWLRRLEMAQIVDELFVEIHYRHPSMLDYGWGQFTHTWEEAAQLMAELRAKGFFVHAWP